MEPQQDKEYYQNASIGHFETIRRPVVEVDVPPVVVVEVVVVAGNRARTVTRLLK